MITARNAGKNQARLRAFAWLGEEKAPPLSRRVIYSPAHSDHYQVSKAGLNQKRILFLTERSLNVVENKGPLWKTWERSGNVCEKTGLSGLNRECC
jgi:hypothetical protein